MKVQSRARYGRNESGIYGQAKDKAKCIALTEDTNTPCSFYARKQGFCNIHYEKALKEGIIEERESNVR